LLQELPQVPTVVREHLLQEFVAGVELHSQHSEHFVPA
jgi:hypothetical protein